MRSQGVSLRWPVDGTRRTQPVKERMRSSLHLLCVWDVRDSGRCGASLGIKGDVKEQIRVMLCAQRRHTGVSTALQLAGGLNRKRSLGLR